MTCGVVHLDLAAGRALPLLDGATLDRVERTLDEAVDANAAVMVVTGGAAGTFAAGADLMEMSSLDAMGALAFAQRGQRLFDRMEAAPLILIASIRGRCIGGAFDLAMSCDLRLAGADAVFSHPGPRLGFITGYGGTSRLPLLVGRMARGVLSGRETIDATEALRSGLIESAVPAEQADRRAMDLAERIASAPASRSRLIKRVLKTLGGSERRRLLERPLSALCLLGDDGCK